MKTTTRGGLRKGLALTAAASMAVTGLMLTSPRASAAPVSIDNCRPYHPTADSGHCYEVTRYDGSTGVVWLGTYDGPDGWEAWCLDYFFGTDFDVPGNRRTVDNLISSLGEQIGDDEKSALAYIATHHAPDQVNDRDAAAVSVIIRQIMGDAVSETSGRLFPGGLQVGGTVRDSPLMDLADGLVQRAQQIWDEASAKLGVWTIDIDDFEYGELEGGGSGSTRVEVRSGSGTPVANETVRVTYTGATGPATVTTNSNGVATINFDVTDGAATVRIRVRADSPGVNPEIWQPTNWQVNPQAGHPVDFTQRVLGSADPTVVDDVTEVAIPYPDARTTARDGSDGDQHLSGNQDQVVIDTVYYEDLIPGREYTLRGELMDKATGESTGITADRAFTASSSGTGEVELEFTVPAEFHGTTLVAFERVFDGDREVITHTDINDIEQTVGWPDMGTRATDGADGDKSLVGTGEQIIVDTVSYEGLIPGMEYTLEGELMNVDTGESTGIVASLNFIPTSATGSVDVEFVVPAELQGTTFVAFETLFVAETGSQVAEHTDLEDKGQTVEWPKIGTSASDQADGDKYLAPRGEVTVVDVVRYEGLAPGNEYTVRGELMDKATGDSLGITSEVTFIAESVNGTVELEFVVPAEVQNKTIVAFERVYHGETEIAVHADINDEDQTVYRPEIGTTATDGEDGDKTLAQTGEQTVTDVVRYENLIPGKEYRIAGELMDKATGESTGIVAETTFVADETGTGEVSLEFIVPAELQGLTLVAFERVYDGELEVVTHTDIDDVEQTVYRPDMGTSASDGADGDKYLGQHDEQVVVDVVKYVGLIPGKEYRLDGELMDKVTAESTGITAEATFVADESGTGEVSLEFTVPADLQGKVLVAFERVYDGDVEVMTHTDINDEEQTVYRPNVGTSASDQSDGDKTLDHDGGTVVDQVRYSGLKVGQEYTVKGELMDADTGKGTGIMGEATFVAEASDGVIEVLFEVPADFAGKTLVAFETIFDGELEIAAHTDINDQDQTVFVEDAPVINSGGADGGAVNSVTLAAGAAVLLAGATGAVALGRSRRNRIAAPVDNAGEAGEVEKA